MGSPFKRGYGSFMFNADKPHFFKIILQETIADGKLVSDLYLIWSCSVFHVVRLNFLSFYQGIPKKFVRLYGKGLSNKVLLEVPNGTVSEVELFKSDGKIWLQNGWKEFAEHYSLALGSLLVFEYKNSCHFHVLIMDKTAMEIDYSFSMTDGDEEPDLEGEFQQPKTEETDDDVSVEILDDFPSYHKTNEKSSAPCPEPQKRTRTNFASKFEGTSKLQIRSESVATKQDNSVGKVNSRSLLRQREAYNGWYFSTGGFKFAATRGNRVLPGQRKRLNGVNRAQSLTADEKAATFERASAALKPESPFFMVAMQPSYVYPGCRLPIPKSFAQKYFKNDHGDAVLCVLDGRTWPVKCFVYPGNGKAKTQISSGWNKFTWDNYLEVGDVCVFELTKCIEMSFKVIIVRANKDESHRLAVEMVKMARQVHTINMEPKNKGEEDDSLPPEKKIKNPLPHKMVNNSKKDAGSGLKTKRLAPLSAIEKEKALRRAHAFKSENPFFVIAIQPAYVCSGSNMNLPFKFADRYFKEKNGEVILQVSEGRLWTVDYSWKLKKTFLCSYNWMEFARDNNLEVGDVCVFELIKATELGMNVVILRTEDVSWRPSFCKQGIQVMNCILNSN
ncbi:hypothetical protein POTOM_046361 [Populus tomentosa]|uniref:TF-B3 domain-containing protein n=1 Tax=Populus tomentosa TaxID=118781 RepID=A0A8X8CCL4_POPTO|nr:hypothetical protein POTOM_046361 [Populus tomentosa]